ncbi:MAG: hypothetical protein AAGD25_15895 [Cyanobacteria bacterium P01_F01_bin.150]
MDTGHRPSRKLDNGDIVWDGLAFDITDRRQAEVQLYSVGAG